jgi:hypothetical protein
VLSYPPSNSKMGNPPLAERLSTPFGVFPSMAMTATSEPAFMTKDERRQELERIRDAPGGAKLIVAIFDDDLNLQERSFIPSSFVQAMIELILRHEYPDDSR